MSWVVSLIRQNIEGKCYRCADHSFCHTFTIVSSFYWKLHLCEDKFGNKYIRFFICRTLYHRINNLRWLKQRHTILHFLSIYFYRIAGKLKQTLPISFFGRRVIISQVARGEHTQGCDCSFKANGDISVCASAKNVKLLLTLLHNCRNIWVHGLRASPLSIFIYLRKAFSQRIHPQITLGEWKYGVGFYFSMGDNLKGCLKDGP